MNNNLPVDNQNIDNLDTPIAEIGEYAGKCPECNGDLYKYRIEDGWEIGCESCTFYKN